MQGPSVWNLLAAQLQVLMGSSGEMQTFLSAVAQTAPPQQILNLNAKLLRFSIESCWDGVSMDGYNHHDYDGYLEAPAKDRSQKRATCGHPC